TPGFGILGISFSGTSLLSCVQPITTQSFDLSFLVFPLFVSFLSFFSYLRRIIGIIARKFTNPISSCFEFINSTDGTVEKEPVMRNYQHDSTVIIDEFLQPFQSRNIKV